MSARPVLVALALLGCTEREPPPSPPSPPPVVRPPPPVDPSAEELELVEDVVAGHHTDVEACLTVPHEVAPDLTGTFEVRWVVAADGTVGDTTLVGSTLTSSAAADGGEAARTLERCVLGVVGALRYPAIDAHAVTVHHTFSFASRAAPEPHLTRSGAVRLGVVAATGLAEEIVRRVAERHASELRGCYEPALTTDPTLQGPLVLRVVIGAEGQTSPTVTESHLSTEAAPDGGAAARNVEACIVAAASRWTFPAPEHGAANADVRVALEPAPPDTVLPGAPGLGTISLGGMGLVGS